MTNSEQLPCVKRPGDILALATSTRPWSPSVTVGRAIASRWNGKLTTCSIEVAARTLIDGEPALPDVLPEPGAGHAYDRAELEAFARQSGVRHVDWIITRNGLAKTLRWLGARHDLAVLERDMVPSSSMFSILGDAILLCQLPCLILPPGWNREVRFERVVIGSNGSLEAIRAIHASLPFLKVANQITLVDGSPLDTKGMNAPFDPCIYLSRHGVAPRPKHVRGSFATAGATLLEEARNIDADLLVMGAYGYSRMQERLFGDATRWVLQRATLPVLMQH